LGKARYFTRFSVVELQQTFYEPPLVGLATKWRTLAPEHFQFCIKAWQLITHTPASPTYRRLRSKLSPNEHNLVGSFRPTEQVWLAWQRTLEIARALRARIILFQCPASFNPTREHLQNFRSFFGEVQVQDHLLAWEPRGNWPPELVAELCEEFNLLHCVDPFKDESVPGSPVYWRLHGRNGYSYRYSDDELHQLRNLLLANLNTGREPVYVFFNNVWMKDDALRFQSLMQTGVTSASE
jgi:uncharacterized protein YecE (DUF72 family)